MRGTIAGAETLLAAGANAVATGQPHLEPYVAKDGHRGLDDPAWHEWVAGVKRAGILPMGTSVGSAHQMGSARMGTKPTNSAVDPRGRVWGTQGLYVADTSVFPTGARLNVIPSVISLTWRDVITISASGVRCSAHAFRRDPADLCGVSGESHGHMHGRSTFHCQVCSRRSKVY